MTFQFVFIVRPISSTSPSHSTISFRSHRLNPFTSHGANPTLDHCLHGRLRNSKHSIHSLDPTCRSCSRIRRMRAAVAILQQRSCQMAACKEVWPRLGHKHHSRWEESAIDLTTLSIWLCRVLRLFFETSYSSVCRRLSHVAVEMYNAIRIRERSKTNKHGVLGVCGKCQGTGVMGS